MAPHDKTEELFEPERYEVSEEPRYRFDLNRRDFLEVAGAGLLIFTASNVSEAQRGGSASREAGTLSARLHIGEDGIITVLAGKVEVGQGSRTQLTQAAAEEMRAPIEKIRMVMADTDLVPDDGGTAGSRTTPSTVPAIRKAAAAAREILKETARRAWNVDGSRLEFEDGAVIDRGTKRSLSYADLAKSKEAVEALEGVIPTDVSLTPVAEWKVLGRPVHKVGGREIVTGAHRYPSDILRPNMLYGKVLRPPAYGAKLVSADLAPAEKLKGVTAVHDGGFVGCAAPTSRQAQQALEAVAATARWEQAPQTSSKELFRRLKETAVEAAGRRRPVVRTKGSLADGLAQAKKVVSASYEVAYIQHAPMEPRAAVAEWEDGRLTVWTGTQQPRGVQRQLAETFHLPLERVRVLVPDTGGGFGGKHTGEVAVEAARLAREAGRPVSLRWTRQEEFMWAYFRPAGLFEMQAGLDASGLLVAWDFTNYNAGTAALDSPYRIPHSRARFLYTDSPLREGSYRGIAATANNFAREGFMDELAVSAGTDPLDFRLANIEDARLKAVLETAADRFRWRERKKNRRPGIGVGIAAGFEKGSYVATCVEVEADRGRREIRVLEICEAFECGAIQNPGNLRAQAEGCIIMGLGGALTEEIRFENGRLLNGKFAQYPVPRFKDVPPIDCILIDRKDLPSAGAGETPIIAVAPAIAAAVYDASGVRIRSMPIRGEAL